MIPFIISFEVYSGSTHYFDRFFSFPHMGEKRDLYISMYRVISQEESSQMGNVCLTTSLL